MCVQIEPLKFVSGSVCRVRSFVLQQFQIRNCLEIGLWMLSLSSVLSIVSFNNSFHKIFNHNFNTFSIKPEELEMLPEKLLLEIRRRLIDESKSSQVVGTGIDVCLFVF